MLTLAGRVLPDAEIPSPLHISMATVKAQASRLLTEQGAPDSVHLVISRTSWRW
ncbi:hypothetical protein [Streptomyces sp. NPDC059134]|uniref:hypothetical protein n=1 Tax=Streptomyces sp. NPDC059134 TaxID=3346738 RepID=UPI0036B30301